MKFTQKDEKMLKSAVVKFLKIDSLFLLTLGPISTFCKWVIDHYDRFQHSVITSLGPQHCCSVPCCGPSEEDLAKKLRPLFDGQEVQSKELEQFNMESQVKFDNIDHRLVVRNIHAHQIIPILFRSWKKLKESLRMIQLTSYENQWPQSWTRMKS